MRKLMICAEAFGDGKNKLTFLSSRDKVRDFIQAYGRD